MWGCPFVFDPTSGLGWQILQLAGRRVEHLRIILGVHRHLIEHSKRLIHPTLAYVTPEAEANLLENDKYADELQRHGLSPTSVEHHPLFRYYYFEIDSPDSRKNLVLIY